MPRARKRRTQPVREIPNQPYGMGEQLSQMQRDVPLPNDVMTADPNAAPQPTSQFQRAIEAAQAHPGPLEHGLGAPSDRPNEPVTTGLDVGPGAGPEALITGQGRTNYMADTFEELAQSLRSPRLAEMAKRARNA